ncbi:MBOAT family O-acyltransferase [Herbaspirillum rhizosphaerae]|uniref:MBOAT family O-acyltransferase n=1 Tax=Herbaspirillum rhizosphaerae TaxID=346179 RepID=UPI000B11C8D5|nr:MBOAT family protein [Herbaspirillum rhizosphaerae]
MTSSGSAATVLFNSYEFVLLFLPITFFGFFLLAKIGRNIAASWLVLASLFFYGWWNPKFTLLLLASISFNYLLGYALSRQRPRGRALLTFAIAANLLLLAVFKYSNFFIATASALTGQPMALTDIVLPLGISFYTFTQIAFLVDTWRGVAREYNPLHYLLFVTYFPHLIAGPVLHHKQMMPQFASSAIYKINVDDVAAGLSIFTIGLAKKVLLADSFSQFSTPVFAAADHGIHLHFFAAWMGAVAYTMQLYFDFSGYSDMAIGLSLLFGVRLPINFNSPYKSASIIDFWRRWHMTLSQFLKDYLYIPLGGSRHGKFRTYLNLMATMVLGGLWHGANWTFVCWGALHGIYLLINHAWRAIGGKMGFSSSPRFRPFGVFLTFLAVVVAWVVFRSTTIHSAVLMLGDMLHWPGGYFFDLAEIKKNAIGSKEFFADRDLGMKHFLALTASAACLLWLLPNTQEYMNGSHRLRWRPTKLNALFWGMVFALCLTKMASVSEFLYFQF